MLKKKFEKLLFKLPTGLILLLILSGVIALIFIIYSAVSSTVAGSYSFFVLSVLFLIALFFKISVLTEYGVSVTPFLLFGIILALGSITALLIILAMTFAHIWLTVRETPIDFCIIKHLDTAVMHAFYLFVLVVFTIITLRLYGMAVLIHRLNSIYIIIYALYTIFGAVVYSLTSPVPLGKMVARVGVSLVLNWWLIVNFGLLYIGFLNAL